MTPNLHNITRGQSRDLWFWWRSFLISGSRTSQSWTRTSNSTCTYTLEKLKFHLTKTHFCEIFFFASQYTNIYILPLFTLIKPLSPKLLPHEFLISQYGIPLSVPQPIAKTAWLILFGGALKELFCKTSWNQNTITMIICCCEKPREIKNELTCRYRRLQKHNCQIHDHLHKVQWQQIHIDKSRTWFSHHCNCNPQ